MKFWDFFLNKKPTPEAMQVIVAMERAQSNFKVREVAFWACVNLIANALSRCRVRTFIAGDEVREREWFLWNVEPNTNENASMFIHHLVGRIGIDNEALIVPVKKNGGETLCVADAWTAGKLWPAEPREYRSVKVGEYEYKRPFREEDVLHIRWNEKGIKGVLDAMADSYDNMMRAENDAISYARGQHWKVHVDQTAMGAEGWKEAFRKQLETDFKAFIEARTSVLPEFSGYTYTDVSPKETDAKIDESRKMAEDIWDFTARGFLIPSVLLKGDVAGAENAQGRFWADAIDPLARQIEQEANRKRYGYEQMRAGTYLRIDTSRLSHYDMLTSAADVNRLVGSGMYSVNDIRRAVDEQPIAEEWADRHYMTLNNAPAATMTGGGQN